MKRNLLISLLMVSALFALNSCKKEYLVEVKGTVNGYVRAYYTNEALSGVVVRIIVDDQTILKDSTDANGYYSISNVPSGYFPIVFSKTGYATYRSQIGIDSPNEVSNTTNGKKQSYKYGDTKDVDMSPLTGKINGRVTDDASDSPIANATVVVKVETNSAYSYDKLETVTYNTTTDANGKYSFINLPMGYTINVIAYSGAASGAAASLDLKNMLYSVTPKLLDIRISEEELYLVNYTGKGTSTSYSKLDTTTTSIILTFSENISEAFTKGKGGYIKLIAGGENVLCSVAYSGATATITLPAGTLASGTTYTISYLVYATEIKSANDDVTFRTKQRPASIASTVAALAFADPNFQVTNMPAISGMPTGTLLDFDVYHKSPSDDRLDFRLVSGTSVSGTATQRVISKIGGFAPGQYYVVPKVTGLDGVTVYGVPSAPATRPN